MHACVSLRHVCVCVCVCVCVYPPLHPYIGAHKSACMPASVSIYPSILVYACKLACMHVRMYAYDRPYVCMHTTGRTYVRIRQAVRMYVYDRPSFRSFSVVRKLLLAIFTPGGQTNINNIDDDDDDLCCRRHAALCPRKQKNTPRVPATSLSLPVVHICPCCNTPRVPAISLSLPVVHICPCIYAVERMDVTHVCLQACGALPVCHRRRRRDLPAARRERRRGGALYVCMYV